MVPMGIFPWEIRVALPEESQLRRPTILNNHNLPLLVRAVFLCEHASGCEAYSFTTDGYGIFNARTNLPACRTRVGRCYEHKQLCTKIDSEGLTLLFTLCFIKKKIVNIVQGPKLILISHCAPPGGFLGGTSRFALTTKETFTKCHSPFLGIHSIHIF